MLFPLPPNPPPPPPLPDADDDVFLLLKLEAPAVPRGPTPAGPTLPAPAEPEPPFETVDDAWLCDPFTIAAYFLLHTHHLQPLSLLLSLVSSKP